MSKFLCLFLFISTISVRSDSFSSLTTRQQKAVKSVLEKQIKKQKLVSLAVGIISKGKISFLKAYGFADKSKNIPANTDTIYNWASNSKPLLATAAVQLIENKKLDIDKDVRDYVPSFPDKGEIKIKQE